MRLVFVYRLDDADDRRYLFRRPLVWAWLLSLLTPEYDYARFWFQSGGE